MEEKMNNLTNYKNLDKLTKKTDKNLDKEILTSEGTF